MKKTLSLIAWLLLLGLNTQAQTRQMIKPRNLTVGDRVPDIFIPKLINYKAHSASLADFKKQLLILDFWSINCSGCVAGLPKMQALQQQFGDRVKILPVTYDPEARTVAFWKKNRYTKDLVIPSVVADKTLSAWFRHAGVPHEVWIDKGVVVGITFADYVTAANIQLLLDGKKPGWPVKNDFLRPFDVKKPFLNVDPNQYADATGPVKYAAVFGYREQDMGVMPGIVRDTTRHTVRMYLVNNTIPGAYYYYWHELRDPGFKKGITFYPDANRLVLEVKDPLDYASIEETGGYINVWHRKHLFCYESVSPDTGQSREALCRSAIADLDHLLKLHGRFEMRKVKCLVLAATGQNDTTLGVKSLIQSLNQQKNNAPVIDGTGLEGTKEPDLHGAAASDIPAVRKALQAYGLDLKEEERELEMFVLTEVK